MPNNVKYDIEKNLIKRHKSVIVNDSSFFWPNSIQELFWGKAKLVVSIISACENDDAELCVRWVIWQRGSRRTNHHRVLSGARVSFSAWKEGDLGAKMLLGNSSCGQKNASHRRHLARAYQASCLFWENLCTVTIKWAPLPPPKTRKQKHES